MKAENLLRLFASVCAGLFFALVLGVAAYNDAHASVKYIDGSWTYIDESGDRDAADRSGSDDSGDNGDGDSGDSDGGDDDPLPDEDDDKGHGNDEDGHDDDNPGKGKYK